MRKYKDNSAEQTRNNSDAVTNFLGRYSNQLKKIIDRFTDSSLIIGIIFVILSAIFEHSENNGNAIDFPSPSPDVP